MKAQHDIYRNLHTHTWSQVDRSTGLVASHPHEALILDASFVVQPAGNRKVRKDKKKHVHASPTTPTSTPRSYLRRGKCQFQPPKPLFSRRTGLRGR